jgi:hypothetical protein
MDNPQELKKAILAVLAEKGDYQTLANLVMEGERRQRDDDKSESLTKLIKPMSAVADILT